MPNATRGRGRPRSTVRTPATAPARRRQRLGDAIRAARGDLTQLALATRLGVRQPTLSAWEAGKVDLTLEQVHTIEEMLDLAPGHLARVAGFQGPLEGSLSTVLDGGLVIVEIRISVPAAGTDRAGSRAAS